MKYKFLRKILRRTRKGDLFDDFRDVSIAEGRLRRATAYVVCFVIIGLTSIALILNLIEGNYGLIAPLSVVIALAGIALAWLWIKKTSEFGPLYVCMVTLSILGGVLLLWRCAPYGASLFWFLLFPPMIMFCLGLRQGTLVFCVFMFFLVMLMATPLETLLAEQFPRSVRIRFLVAMVGAFVFSWGAEYTRFQTQKTLSRTLARLELDSLTDHLTGLGNRRNFCNFYNISFLGTSARKQPFTLAIADIDHFKHVNDTFGHEVGDKVLCHVADVFLSWCRETDKLYRWGGEEFLLFMPRTSAAESRPALERMRQALAETPYRSKDGTLMIPVTASFGLCEGNAENDLKRQIRLADQNLYAAKRDGRNRVTG